MSAANENCCDFAGNYDLSKLPAIKKLEQSALGCDYGGTSWTTRQQVDVIVASLELNSDSRDCCWRNCHSATSRYWTFR